MNLESITIVGGRDKAGNAENVRLELFTGSVTAIVGPTGSGKSRLLADIEWMAQNDTPTGRTVLINNDIPAAEYRFSPQNKLVAQLSQNMNFVMDATVGEFIRLHAACRTTGDCFNAGTMQELLRSANLLAGEPFDEATPLTSLSGGQSRALMIADTALLSASPVVLIDEIENAGIDRKQALDLLVRKEKIILLATHDPILALMAEQRIVIRNGGIISIIQTTPDEKRILSQLEAADRLTTDYRIRLREGERLK